MRLIDADADALIARINNSFGSVTRFIIKSILKDAPTIEAEPVRYGRWEMRGGRRYCSVCKERACVTRDREDFWYTVGTNYCPNCGAKMGRWC